MGSRGENAGLLALIDRIAHKFPGEIAVSCAELGDLSRERLFELSKQLSISLENHGVAAGDRVVILVRRSAAVVVAMLAVLRLGACYVPLAHSTPEKRLQKILTDCQPRIVVCDSHTSPRIIDLISEQRIRPLRIKVSPGEIGVSQVHGVSEIQNISSASADTTFSIIYTSGSTGEPKGVVITHGNMQDYVDWSLKYFCITDRDRIFCTAPFHFDMSSFDVYASLASGAQLVLASEKDCLFPKQLVARMQNMRVTVWKGVSSLFAHVSTMLTLGDQDFPGLRVLIFSGERLPTKHLVQWMKAVPEASYYNGYGPTEATGMSSCHRVMRPVVATDVVPIGIPCKNTKIMLFHNETMVDKPNCAGEIVISGPGVASGYWRDAEKTRAVFVTQIGDVKFAQPAYRTGDIGCFDEDGNLVFISRVDRQIKFQGYRIELDDIEAALHRNGDVSDAAVVYPENGRNSHITAFFEAKNTVNEGEIRANLVAQLPFYMVPKSIRKIAELPRNDRGKTDYNKLKELCE